MLKTLQLSNFMVIYDSMNTNNFEIVEYLPEAADEDSDAIKEAAPPYFSVTGMTDQERWLVAQIIKIHRWLTRESNACVECENLREKIKDQTAESMKVIRELNGIINELRNELNEANAKLSFKE
jgi:hypothetical protein